MKKHFLLLTALLLSACSLNRPASETYVVVSGEDDTSYLKNVQACPKVHIRRPDIKIVQQSDYKEIFEIKAVGYEGFCYYNEKAEQDRAVVKPKFNITRLSDSDITDVRFSYYLETVEGPAGYLGRKTYFADVKIPVGLKSMDYTANSGELTIPVPGTYNLDIYLGLNADRYNLEFKK